MKNFKQILRYRQIYCGIV